MSDRYSEISVKAANDRLADFRVIDVRTPGEYEGPLGRIPGAELIPMDQVQERIGELQGPRALLLVCRSGHRSGHVCAWLAENGVGAPTNLLGGMIDWRKAGLPVERHQAASLEELAGRIRDWFGPLVGMPPARADAAFSRMLAESGGSADALTVPAMRKALDRMVEVLQESGPPAEMDTVLTAFRDDLERL